MPAKEGPCVTLAQHGGVPKPRLVPAPASVACGGRGAAAEDPQPCFSTRYCVTWAVIEQRLRVSVSPSVSWAQQSRVKAEWGNPVACCSAQGLNTIGKE